VKNSWCRLWQRSSCATKVHDWSYVRPFANTLNDSSTIITATSIHAIVNWQLIEQAIRWLVLRSYVAGSGFKLIDVACFSAGQRLLEKGPVTRIGFWIGSRAEASLLPWGRRKEYVQRKHRRKLIPGALLTILPTYFLHNHLVRLYKIYLEKSKTKR